jgi:phage tail sheath protein FI
MPPALTYPGVYIQELSDGIPAIEGVPTSITAFIGRAERGPSDKPVLIHDFADYHERFGGIWAESTMIGADHLASEWKYIPVRRLALYAERSQSARRAMAHPLTARRHRRQSIHLSCLHRLRNNEHALSLYKWSRHRGLVSR